MSELLTLSIIIGSITLFLFLGEKVRVSAISVELLIGMLLGAHGVFPLLSPIEDLNWLQFLADFGFILLMFLAGLELNIHFLKKYFKKSLVLLLSIFIITFLAGVCVGFAFHLEIAASFLIGIVFAGASIGVVFPLIKELGFSEKRLGQILIAATMALDIICILIISLIDFASVGEINVLQFIIVIVIILSAFLVIIFFVGPFWKYVESKTIEVKALEWEIRITFAVIMLLAVLTGVVLEIEEIIGAFLAGMIMGQSKSAMQIKEKIGSIGYGFFIPIFFFVLGMKTDMSYFSDPGFIMMLGTFIIILFLVKIGSSIFGSKLIGFNWKTGLVTGLIMIPSLSVGLAAAELGNEAGFFTATPELFTLLITLIIVSSIIIPILTRTSAEKLLPELISKESSWQIHLEYDLGIYLDEYYHNIFNEVTIKDLPTKKFVRLHPGTPVLTILGFIEKFHQMDFPVVSEDNKLIGIVDFNEVKKAIIENKFKETAETIMHKDVVYVVPSDKLATALDKMKKTNLELLPIVEPETLNFLGTITRDAILRFVRIHALGASISPEDQEKLAKQRIWYENHKLKEGA